MKYFKKDGEVYAYEEDANPAYYEDKVEMTQAEVDEFLRDKRTPEEIAADEREVQEAQAKQLRENARLKIDDLQTRIKYKRYKSEDDLANMQAQIEQLTIYRMDLEDFINGDLQKMPESPSS